MSNYSAALKHEASPLPGKKFFTLSEARRALPLVKRIAADIHDAQSHRLRIHAELSAGMADLALGGHEALQREFDDETDHLESLVAELGLIGVELKDPSRVLLDFPAMHEGREILLCWKSDEENIDFWHELDGGYAARKPVSELADVH